MSFINVKLREGVFTEEQKHAMAADLTDVMVRYEGSEAFRAVVWVLIEELHPDGWHIAGSVFRGPKSLMEALAHAKETYESIEGHPKTRQEFAAVAPPRNGARQESPEP
jgi:4-oxalocrotonate tautomerase